MKLQGIVPHTIHCELISSKELITLDSQDKIWCVLELKAVHSKQDKPSLSADIQTLVDQFVTLFVGYRKKGYPKQGPKILLKPC